MKQLIPLLVLIATTAGAAGQQSQPAKAPTTDNPSTPITTSQPATRSQDIKQLLDSRVPLVNFDGVPLEEVLQWLEEYTGALVYARWSILKDYKITPDTPITLKTRNRKLSRILWVIMNEAAGASGVTLAYQASNDLIVLSTHEDLSRNMVMRVYDVSRVSPDKYRFWLDGMRQTAEGRRGKVWRTRVRRYPAASTGLVGSDLGIGARPPPREIICEDERLAELRELILNFIEPESWEVNGYGGKGTIFPYKGRLMVRNSLYVHQMIDDLVEQPGADASQARDSREGTKRP